MKSPLWILNSILAVFLLIFILCISFLRPFRPARIPLLGGAAPSMHDLPNTLQIDPSQIYKNDLFATYVEIKAQEPVAERKAITVPQPPQAQVPTAEQTVPPQFLPPLALTIKGVMFSRNDADNRAIIADTKTKKETLSRVGDTLLDAEIVHIGSNKVIFIRSNGQQETLFLTAADAQADSIYHGKDSWEKVTQQISESSFNVHYDELLNRVDSLASFMNMLDVTTAFREGKIIGCRIGGITAQSIGTALGFHQGDIVTSINKIPTVSTKQRIDIFNTLTNKAFKGPIEVQLTRNDQNLTLTYTLIFPVNNPEREIRVQPHTGHSIRESGATHQPKVEREVPQSIPLSIDQNQIQKLQKRDREAMFNHGGRTSLMQAHDNFEAPTL